MTAKQKQWVLLGIPLVCVTAMFFVERIKQDVAYHLFADSRVIAYVPNLFNVLTNLPFVIVGILGLKLCRTANSDAAIAPSLLSYTVFFIGVLLTGVGSSYYHLSPDNFTLLWDRLPLAVLGMGLFCAVVSDCISAQLGLRLLVPLIVVAITSVLYWYYSESQGQGDLRWYVLAQFLPMLLLPLILWLYSGNERGCGYVWGVLGVYLLARIAEALDVRLYGLLGFSGHSIKHLLAGYSTYIAYAALKKRLY